MRAAWLWAAVLLTLLTLVAPDRAVALWAGATVAAVLLGGLLVGRLLAGLAVSEALSGSEVFAGEPVRLYLRVTNRSLLPLPVLRCEVALPRRLERRPARWLASLAPGETFEASFAFRPMRRGVYRVGRVAMEVGDWFGLWRRAGRADLPLWLTVFPRPLAAEVLPPPPRLPAGERRLPVSPFRAWEPAGLREYRRGDPPRWIAWKASAHRGDLVVREFPPVRDRAHLLLLDLRASSWPQPHPERWVERALSLAAAWAARAVERDEPVGLYAWGRAVRFEPEADGSDRPVGAAPSVPSPPPADARGDGPGAGGTPAGPRAGAVDLPARRGARQRRQVLRLLALLQPAEGPPFAAGALAAARRSPCSSVLWIAGRADADTLGGAAEAVRAGHAVALVVPDEAAGQGRPAPGITLWRLAPDAGEGGQTA